MKTCSICKKDFPANSKYFHTNGLYFRTMCRICRNDSKREDQKTYKQNNKDKQNGYERKRRALKKNNAHEFYTENDVLVEYGNYCYLCNNQIDLDASRKVGKPGWEKGLHIDHVIAIANGGPDTLANVRPSHGLCNLSKNAKVI